MSSPIAIDESMAIYAADLHAYRRDQIHIKEQQKAQRFNRIHKQYEAMRALKSSIIISLTVLLAAFPLTTSLIHA